MICGLLWHRNLTLEVAACLAEVTLTLDSQGCYNYSNHYSDSCEYERYIEFSRTAGILLLGHTCAPIS